MRAGEEHRRKTSYSWHKAPELSACGQAALVLSLSQGGSGYPPGPRGTGTRAAGRSTCSTEILFDVGSALHKLPMHVRERCPGTSGQADQLANLLPPTWRCIT